MADTSTGKIYPVILSGGSGTRLWPLSRALYPKQLQPLHSELSLLQEAASRLRGASFANPLIICNQEHRFIVAEQLQNAELVIFPEVGHAPAFDNPDEYHAAVIRFLQSDPDEPADQSWTDSDVGLR